MTVKFGLYDPTGHIVINGKCLPSDVTKQAIPGLEVIEISENIDIKNAYVDVSLTVPEVKQKLPAPYSIDKTTITADSIDTVTVTNLPSFVRVYWPDGLVTEETDGFVEFSIDVPGVHRLKIESIEYYTEVYDVIASN